ncbi:hypothetical protein C8F04DRAFT_1188085 [Mycena alexandri]|uniref:Uncharacterized protein n=1 Tax=Mycena alexandri TaxID=1745969 RepID=A0AAD6SKJ6_9AGAR|nr:hypothetical protein C8F04DRAFT_1188085 [Mycena alexandri]
MQALQDEWELGLEELGREDIEEADEDEVLEARRGRRFKASDPVAGVDTHILFWVFTATCAAAVPAVPPHPADQTSTLQVVRLQYDLSSDRLFTHNAFLHPSGPPPEPTVLTFLDGHIQSFRAALPPLPGEQTLLLTHALVDFAIVRLHAPYIWISEGRRAKCLDAAARIIVSVGTANLVDSGRIIDPMLIAICTGGDAYISRRNTGSWGAVRA